MFNRIGLGIGLKIFFAQANWIPGFGGLNLFFLVILSQITVQCVKLFTDKILAHYLCTLLSHIFFMYLKLSLARVKFPSKVDCPAIIPKCENIMHCYP
jgi:hypothetical protein